MLAVVYGLEKFHYYVYGRAVTVETDQKPLEAIFKKYLSAAPPRIARMMLRIQKYDVEIKYVQRKKIPLADAFSRISPCPGDTTEGLDVSLHEIHLQLNASPSRIGQIKEETVKDEVLLSLRSVITQGWPNIATATTSFICMTIQTHTVLQKLCLGIKITTQDNYVTLIIICHERQNKLKYIVRILYIDKVIRRVCQFIDQNFYR